MAAVLADFGALALLTCPYNASFSSPIVIPLIPSNPYHEKTPLFRPRCFPVRRLR